MENNNVGNATGTDLSEAQIEPLLKDWFGLGDCTGLFNPGRLLAFANAARRATPQHSVTEQAKGPTIDLDYLALDAIRKSYVSAFGPLDPNITANDIDWHIQEIIKEAARAKPLASTAATQPEHASEIVPFRLGNEYQTQAGEWVRFKKVHNEGTSYETMEDQHGHNRYTRRDFGRCTRTAHDYSDPGNTPPLYRAALAIPASTAASEQTKCQCYHGEYCPTCAKPAASERLLSRQTLFTPEVLAAFVDPELPELSGDLSSHRPAASGGNNV